MSGSQRWTLAVSCGATAILLLDVTVVNVALPAIERDLGASFAELQWVVDAYALALAGVLLAAGSLADRLGRRRVFLAGLALFTAASLGCALAAEAWVLDVARGVQGLGAAAMFATSLALLAAGFPDAGRGLALGVWGATSGAAIAIGPLVGGGLVDVAGWEWAFLLNLPVGLALGVAALARVPESREPGDGAIDWIGAALFTAASFLAVLGLIRGEADGWGSTAIVAELAAAAVLLAAFAAWELRAPAPMLDPRLFRIPAFAGTAAVAFAQSVAIYPMFLFLAIYLESLLGYGPFETGVRLLPLTLVLLAVAPLSGRLTGRVALRWLLGAGLLALAAGLLALRAIEPGGHWSAALPGLVIGGVALGLISPALAAAMVGVLPAARAGLASGVNNTFRQLGIAAGIAALGAVFQARIAARLDGAGLDGAELAEAGAQGRLAEVATSLPAAEAARVAAAADDAFVAGLDAIFAVAAAVALAGALVAVALLRPADFAAADGATRVPSS